MSIFKTPSGRWGVRIDLDRGADGRRRQKKLGTYRTQKEAQKAEREAFGARERGIDLDPDSMTVTELVNRFIENRVASGLERKTIQEYRAQQRLYVDPHLGTIQVLKLKKAMVSVWLTKLTQSGGAEGKPLAAKTVKHAYGLLSSAITWGISIDIGEYNVCQAVKPPKVPQTPVTALSDTERTDIALSAEDSRWAVFIALSILLGTRRGEIVALNRSDVDFDRREVTIAKSMSQITGEVFVKSTKTDRIRVLPVNDEIVALFRKQFAQQAADRLSAGEKYIVDPARPVFTDEMGRRISPKAATMAYHRLAKKAGLSSTRLHSTRHTAATLLIRLGADLRTVGDILGNDPKVAIGVYGHLVPGAKREALGLLSDHVERTRREKVSEG